MSIVCLYKAFKSSAALPSTPPPGRILDLIYKSQFPTSFISHYELNRLLCSIQVKFI